MAREDDDEELEEQNELDQSQSAIGDQDNDDESQDEVDVARDEDGMDEDDPNAVKNLRARYKLLEDAADSARHDIHSLEPKALSRGLFRAQSLLRKVQRVPEFKIDARLISLIANLGAQKARELKISSGSFSIDLFLSKLKTLMADGMDDGRARTHTQARRQAVGPSQRSAANGRGSQRHQSEDGDDTYDVPLNWSRLGKMVALGGYTRRAPSIDFMLGPLSIEVRARTVTQRAPLDRSKASQIQVHQVQESEVERSVNETSHNVRIISKVLQAACSGPRAIDGKVTLVEFFLNPTSFSQSVENLFYLSFLIKDGLACIDQTEDDESGELYLFACQNPDDEDYANGLVRKQLVFELTMDVWRDLIQLYKIASPMIPTRSPVITGSSKWYG